MLITLLDLYLSDYTFVYAFFTCLPQPIIVLLCLSYPANQNIYSKEIQIALATVFRLFFLESGISCCLQILMKFLIIL